MAAISFLTVVGRAHMPDRRTLAWFPVVGAVLGAAVAGVWWASERLWPPAVAALVAVVADLTLTGLLHVDGLADTADGLLAPMPRSRRLEVMRKPDIGAFAVAVVSVVILARWAALSAEPVEPVALVGVWCVSRTIVAVIPAVVPYGREQGLATPLVDGARRWYAVWLVPAALLLTLWRGPLGALAVVVAVATAAGVVALAVRRLGGFTGDVLGAVILCKRDNGPADAGGDTVTDPPPAAAMAAAAGRWDTRAKPPGSLGRLERLAVQLAGIAGRCPPPAVERPCVAVFAADHGVARAGASAWPPEVTALMVRAMATGGAAINALAATVGARVVVVDVGVDGDLSDVPGVVHHKVRAGTDDIARGPAMSRGEALAALQVGATVAADLVDEGVDCLVGGDMGIGNTTASAALVAALTASSAESVTGPGAGLAPDRLPHKRLLVARAVRRAPISTDPVDLLAEVGGLEIAALSGLFLAAASRSVPVVVDGVAAAAALCVAERLAPGCATRCVAGHRSTEPAAGIALDHLGLEPVLDLQLRLGEGTGACLAIPVLKAAVRALTDMVDLPAS